jgi:hypothetical protein
MSVRLGREGLPKWIYYDEVRLVVINRGIPDNKRV